MWIDERGRALLETTFEQRPDNKEPAGQMGEEGYTGEEYPLCRPLDSRKTLAPKHREDRHLSV